jgi:hypothetical protein
MNAAHVTSIVSYKTTGGDSKGHVYDERDYLEGNLLLHLFPIMAVTWELLGQYCLTAKAA